MCFAMCLLLAATQPPSLDDHDRAGQPSCNCLAPLSTFNRLDKRAGFAAMIVANVTALGPCSMCEKHLASVDESADFVFFLKVQQRHSIGMLPNRTLLKAYLCNAWCNDSHHRHR